MVLKWGNDQLCDHTRYWNEEGKVVLSQKAEKDILEATFQLHNMALTAVDTVVNDDKLMTLFGINKKLWPAVRYSWSQNQVDMQGRFDFHYNGTGPPLLLEYNADTPSLIIESGALQEEWFKNVAT